MNNKDYGALDKALHYLALNFPAISEASFEINKSVTKADISPDHNSKHVYVSGLARAGTTILMRNLYHTGAFCSLSYRDMPFVLAPNLWERVTRLSVKNTLSQERSHGDGIMVDFDSPEALEEVFWRIFCGKEYIKENGLYCHLVDDKTIATYREYIALILFQHGKKRYLAKNNNNVLRLDSIVSAFPNVVILIPFRDPVAQAESLLKQHHRFLKIQDSDRFSLKYMNWLVHHEFGANHLSMMPDKFPTASNHFEHIEYWLSQWCAVYRNMIDLITRYPENCYPFCYERFCQSPDQVWKKLVNLLALDADTRLSDPIRQSANTHAAKKDDMRGEEKEIYDHLDSVFLSTFLV